jgi:hypothetical protein
MLLSAVALWIYAAFLGRTVTARMNTVERPAEAGLRVRGGEVVRCPVPDGTSGLPENVSIAVDRVTGEIVTTRNFRASFREDHLVLVGMPPQGEGRVHHAGKRAWVRWGPDGCAPLTWEALPEPLDPAPEAPAEAPADLEPR